MRFCSASFPVPCYLRCTILNPHPQGFRIIDVTTRFSISRARRRPRLDRAVGEEMTRIFFDDLRHAKEITAASMPQRSWFQWLLERGANLDTRLLGRRRDSGEYDQPSDPSVSRLRCADAVALSSLDVLIQTIVVSLCHFTVMLLRSRESARRDQ